MQDNQNLQNADEDARPRPNTHSQSSSEQNRRLLTAALKKGTWKHSLAQKIVNSDIILSYITDKYGFRKGVVLAIGAGQLGWSLVSKEDHEYRDLGIEQLPWLAAFIQHPNRYRQEEKKLSAKKAIDILIHDPAFKSWSANGGMIQVPQFNRIRGIEDAYNRAILYSKTMPGKGLNFSDVPLPNDPDLMRALEIVNRRSYYHFKDDPHTFKAPDLLQE